MELKFIEATQTAEQNWGKFMVGRFTYEEWCHRSVLSAGRLLAEVGWNPKNIIVFDLQTKEGAAFSPHGVATIDLNEKHQIWVCPMYEPFLSWLYEQDLTDLSKLPDKVVLDIKDFDIWGYRRKRKEE